MVEDVGRCGSGLLLNWCRLEVADDSFRHLHEAESHHETFTDRAGGVVASYVSGSDTQFVTPSHSFPVVVK